MKSLKTILTMGLLLVSTTSFAQFANGGNSSNGSNGGGLVKKTDNYSRIYVGYNPMTLTYDIKGADDFTYPGLTFGFTQGINLSKNLPLFLEVGARFTFNFKSKSDDEDYDEDDDYYYSLKKSASRAGNYWDDDSDDDDEDEVGKTKYTAASLTVPINIAYKLSFAGGDFSVTPFLGVTLKGNLISKEKYELGKEKETIDNFDKKDVGKDGQWKRFQAGWQIGTNLDYKAFSLGLHYGSDFTEVCKKTKSKNFCISLGYNF